MTRKIDYHEAAEIANEIMQINNPEEDIDITEEALADKYNISLEDFHTIVQKIFNMMDFGLSPLTQTPYVGISEGNRWIVNKDVNQQFIASLISWATEGNDLAAGEGYARTITCNGQPEYTITIRKADPDAKENL